MTCTHAKHCRQLPSPSTCACLGLKTPKTFEKKTSLPRGWPRPTTWLWFKKLRCSDIHYFVSPWRHFSSYFLLFNMFSSLWGPLHAILFNLIIFLLLYAHSCSVFSDPGIVPLPAMGLDFSDIHKNKGSGDTLVRYVCFFLFFNI